MGGYGEFTILVFRNGKQVAATDAAWDWDDDDENRLRLSANIPKPEDF
jgi:hypothetical protein